MINLLLFNNLYPVISDRRVRKGSDELLVYGSVTRYGPQSVFRKHAVVQLRSETVRRKFFTSGNMFLSFDDTDCRNFETNLGIQWKFCHDIRTIPEQNKIRELVIKVGRSILVIPVLTILLTFPDEKKTCNSEKIVNPPCRVSDWHSAVESCNTS